MPYCDIRSNNSFIIQFFNVESYLFWFTTEYFYNPIATVKLTTDIKLIHRWYLSITPSYSLFFESQKTGQFLSLDCGIKMLY